MPTIPTINPIESPLSSNAANMRKAEKAAMTAESRKPPTERNPKRAHRTNAPVTETPMNGNDRSSISQKFQSCMSLIGPHG